MGFVDNSGRKWHGKEIKEIREKMWELVGMHLKHKGKNGIVVFPSLSLHRNVNHGEIWWQKSIKWL